MTTHVTPPTPTPAVAFLGLGRLGTAIAHRLDRCGWHVTTWSRSGRTADGLDAAPDPASAAADATYVVLCLLDGDACRATVDRLAPALTTGTVVVNLSTVGPDEAAELDATVTRAGATYVHAPVLGSVGPAAEGGLTVLVGTHDGDERADAVLRDLGTPVPVGGPADAAGAKLVASAVLAGSLLTVGDAVTAAVDLGLSADVAYDVLERSPLGRLVAAKRDRLDTGDVTGADFTTAALRKDVALLAGASGHGHLLHRLDDALGGLPVDADHDVAELALPRKHTGPATELRDDLRLDLAPDVDVPGSVLEPLADRLHRDPRHGRPDPSRCCVPADRARGGAAGRRLRLLGPR